MGLITGGVKDSGTLTNFKQKINHGKKVPASADCRKLLSVELGTYSFFFYKNPYNNFSFSLCWRLLVR